MYHSVGIMQSSVILLGIHVSTAIYPTLTLFVIVMQVCSKFSVYAEGDHAMVFAIVVGTPWWELR